MAWENVPLGWKTWMRWLMELSDMVTLSATAIRPSVIMAILDGALKCP